ncbi:hypothetical protein F4703DRAFT_1947944 [Phycomyces blakesleeanus]
MTGCIEECRSPNRMRGRNQFIRSVVEKIFFCFGRVTVKTGFVYSSAWTLLGADQTVLRLLGADQTVLETIGCGPDGFDTTICLKVSFSIGHAWLYSKFWCIWVYMSVCVFVYMLNRSIYIYMTACLL